MASNLGQPVKNKHKVPLRQWRKWPNAAKKLFNDMMYSMRPSMQWAFMHPDQPVMARKHWETTRWNAAWSAADCLSQKLPMGAVIQQGKRYTRRPKGEAK